MPNTGSFYYEAAKGSTRHLSPWIRLKTIAYKKNPSTKQDGHFEHVIISIFKVYKEREEMSCCSVGHCHISSHSYHL